MTDPPKDMTGGTRDGNGRYTRDPLTAMQDAEAARLRSEGRTFQQIADTLGVGIATAFRAVERTVEAAIREPAEAVIAHSLRNLDEERGRLADRRADIIANRDRVHAMHQGRHILVQHGKVIYEDDGSPVLDDEMTLKIADRIVRIDDQLMRVDEQLRRNDESRRRLEGLDQPAKTEVSGGVTYEIVGVSPDLLA